MQEVREAQSVKHREANSAKMKMKGSNIIFLNHRIRIDTFLVLWELCKSKVLIKKTCNPTKHASDQTSFRYQRRENNTKIRL